MGQWLFDKISLIDGVEHLMSTFGLLILRLVYQQPSLCSRSNCIMDVLDSAVLDSAVVDILAVDGAVVEQDWL